MSDHTTDSPTDDVDDVLADEQLVLEDTKLAEAAEQIKERRAQIKAALARRYDVGTHPLAGRQVIVSEPGRLDAKALERDYPITEHPELYEAKLSTAAVRGQIAAALLDAEYTTHGSKQVTIR
jgi:hypothetical protein